ncbi:MAG: HK97 gp10 family phage protein [Elusimicrobia bacterium]|nr:HK97 gp10 family phage protein [Elusimicrobiota bacterium]
MAAPKVTAIVTGDADLDANLRALDDAMRTRIAKSAVNAGAKEIAKAERALAPVRSGTLRSAISSRIVKGSSAKGVEAKAGINVGKRSAGRVVNQSTHTKSSGVKGLASAPHSHLVALGTRARVRQRIGGKFAYLEPSPRSRSTGTMPANPFIKVASQTAQSSARFAIKQAIVKGVQREVNRFGKRTGRQIAGVG